MSRQLFLIIICAVLLAACGGNNTATPVPAAQQGVPTTSAGATPEPVVPTQGPRQYNDGTEEVELPIPGTIIAPVTPDPEAGTLFDSVELNQSGGIAGKELNVIVKRDGSVIRDGVSSTITADQVKQIADMLDQMGFFGMEGVFQAPGTSADMYVYRITVERNGSRRNLTAQEGYIPPQLTELLQVLLRLGTTQ